MSSGKETFLDLSNKQIGDEDARKLADKLKNTQTLQTLYLTNNQIGPASAQALGAALQVNCTLQWLHLWDNQIGDAGAQALGAALQVNQTLQGLDLGNNQIGDAGVQALGVALQVNQTLQWLDLGNNQIGDASAQALGAALEVNQMLQSLVLWHNQIGNAGAQALGAALEVNQMLQWLHLGNNQIGDAGAQALGTALKVNQTLQCLYLWRNQIGNTGVQAIATTLQCNFTLHRLYIHENGIITEETLELVAALLRENERFRDTFGQQIQQVQNFLRSHQNEEYISLQDLPKLQELLLKWPTDAENIISSLQKSEERHFDKRYEGIITTLTSRLYELWLESFDREVIALTKQYVIGKKTSVEPNIELGYALYEMWLTFLGSDCPNWIENHLQSLRPFSVLLDIAEGGRKKDVTELKDTHSLFERVRFFSKTF